MPPLGSGITTYDRRSSRLRPGPGRPGEAGVDVGDPARRVDPQGNRPGPGPQDDVVGRAADRDGRVPPQFALAEDRHARDEDVLRPAEGEPTLDEQVFTVSG